MPHNWWTRRTLILAAAAIALACAISFGGIGLSYPEPVASAALGPDWQCSRLAFLFTTCIRVKNSQAAVPVSLVKIPVCGRLRT
jgi:adenine-specific DNA methylase